jgi:hypothetical protein
MTPDPAFVNTLGIIPCLSLSISLDRSPGFAHPFFLPCLGDFQRFFPSCASICVVAPCSSVRPARFQTCDRSATLSKDQADDIRIRIPIPRPPSPSPLCSTDRFNARPSLPHELDRRTRPGPINLGPVRVNCYLQFPPAPNPAARRRRLSTPLGHLRPLARLTDPAPPALPPVSNALRLPTADCPSGYVWIPWCGGLQRWRIRSPATTAVRRRLLSVGNGSPTRALDPEADIGLVQGHNKATATSNKPLRRKAPDMATHSRPRPRPRPMATIRFV